MSLFNNKKVDIWKKSKTVYAITAKSPRLAATLNRVLRQYSEDTKFSRFDEPVFKIVASQIESIALQSRFLSKIFTQIGMR